MKQKPKDGFDAIFKQIEAGLTISDILTSQAFHGLLERFAKKVIRTKEPKPLTVDLRDDDHAKDLAYTDNTKITIFVKNDAFYACLSGNEKLMVTLGLFFHEMAHCFFTSFKTLSEWIESSRKGEWYPVKPETNLDLSNRKDRSYLLHMGKQLSNILEDGYVERKMTEKYGCLVKESIDFLNRIIFRMIGSLEDIREEKGFMVAFVQGILIYSLTYDDSCGFRDATGNEDLRCALAKAKLIIKKYDRASNKKKYEFVNELVALTWEYKAVEPKAPQSEMEQAGSMQNASPPTDERSNDESSGGTVVPEPEDSKDGDEGNIEHDPTTPPEKHEENNEAAPEPGDDQQTPDSGHSEFSSETEENHEGNTNSEPDTDAVGESTHNNGSAAETAESCDEENTARPGNGTETREDCGANGECDDAEVDPDPLPDLHQLIGSTIMPEREENYIPNQENLDELLGEKTIGDLLNEISREIAHEATQDIIDSETMSVLSQYNHRDDVAGTDVIYRESTANREINKDILEQLNRSSEHIGFAIGKGIERHLKVINQTAPRNGYTGQVAKKNLYRRDRKIFQKKADPKRELDLSMMILVDRSGSTDTRIHHADFNTIVKLDEMLSYNAAVLHAMCEQLDIPCMVMGYRSDNLIRACDELEVYCAYEGCIPRSRLRMFSVGGDGCNRDGVFFRSATRIVEKRSEKIRIVLILSDGQPDADGYYGDLAYTDTRNAVVDMKRKGLYPIIAGVGRDAQRLQQLYGSEYFLDVSDPSQLQKKMEFVMKRIVKMAI